MKGSIYTLQVDGTRSRFDVVDATPSDILNHIKAGLNGGLLETVPYFDTYEGQSCVAFCDEEGKMKHMPLNIDATVCWARQLNTPLSKMSDVLVGPVVIVTGDDAFMAAL